MQVMSLLKILKILKKKLCTGKKNRTMYIELWTRTPNSTKLGCLLVSSPLFFLK